MTGAALALVGGKYDGAEIPTSLPVVPSCVWIEKPGPVDLPAGELPCTSYGAASWVRPPPGKVNADAAYLLCQDGLYRERRLKEALRL